MPLLAVGPGRPVCTDLEDISVEVLWSTRSGLCLLPIVFQGEQGFEPRNRRPKKMVLWPSQDKNVFAHLLMIHTYHVREPRYWLVNFMQFGCLFWPKSTSFSALTQAGWLCTWVGRPSSPATPMKCPEVWRESLCIPIMTAVELTTTSLWWNSALLWNLLTSSDQFVWQQVTVCSTVAQTVGSLDGVPLEKMVSHLNRLEDDKLTNFLMQ